MYIMGLKAFPCSHLTRTPTTCPTLSVRFTAYACFHISDQKQVYSWKSFFNSYTANVKSSIKEYKGQTHSSPDNTATPA